jgi:hypothetical protein
MRLPILTAAAAVALLAGCSSAAAKPAAPTPSPSPTASTATITQYASKLNGPLKDFRGTWQKYEDACILGDPTAIACVLYVQTINLEMKTIQSVIEGATTKGVPAFIGNPPAEINALVVETDTVASNLEGETGGNKPVDGWQSDANHLDSLVDQWGPYLGG